MSLLVDMAIDVCRRAMSFPPWLSEKEYMITRTSTRATVQTNMPWRDEVEDDEGNLFMAWVGFDSIRLLTRDYQRCVEGENTAQSTECDELSKPQSHLHSPLLLQSMLLHCTHTHRETDPGK